MDTDALVSRARGTLNTLCRDLPDRRLGGEGNGKATDFFAAALRSFGFETATPSFECLDWTGGGAELSIEGIRFAVEPSPFALGCRTRAPLIVVSTLEELDAGDLEGKLVLLRGDLTRGQLLPKNFPFYRDEVHARILARLEAARPTAIVAAVSPDPAMAGARYPYPLIEDGDFDIPSVFTTQEEGLRLAARAGETAELESRAWRRASTGCNVVGRKDQGMPRLVFTAHIDSKAGSPGANDNASGVAALLLLAELVADDRIARGLEIVALNGEDYYSNPGELLYLEENVERFSEIRLAVNIDSPAFVVGRVAYSMYGCPDEVARVVREVFSDGSAFVEGPPWFQGDHSLFVQNGVPAIAFTSEAVDELSRNIIHSPNDTPATVDASKLAALAVGLRELLRRVRAPAAAGDDQAPTAAG